MKFHNGCWLMKEGVSWFGPQHVYETHIAEKEVRLVAPTSRIRGKGDTLGGINLTLRITSPAPEVLRVQTYHHKGVQACYRPGELVYDVCAGLQAGRTDRDGCVCTGCADRCLRRGGSADGGHHEGGAAGPGLCED